LGYRVKYLVTVYNSPWSQFYVMVRASTIRLEWVTRSSNHLTQEDSTQKNGRIQMRSQEGACVEPHWSRIFVSKNN